MNRERTYSIAVSGAACEAVCRDYQAAGHKLQKRSISLEELWRHRVLGLASREAWQDLFSLLRNPVGRVD